MGRKRQQSKGKKIKPNFWVFCEGKTEASYVSFLRSKYRVPIEIISKIAGSDIDERYIRSYKRGKPTHPKDIDFLLYDSDVKDVLKRLLKIKKAKLLVSNPSIELWFILHYKNQTAYISTEDCIHELSKRNKVQYKKGLLNNKLIEKLESKCIEACNRAQKLKLLDNPSSNVYEFIEILIEIKKTGT